MSGYDLVIIGAGPAGLSCGYEAIRQGQQPLILEQDSVVGGIARTVRFGDYYFDLGGHRFFTKQPEVEQIWHTILGSELLRRPRLSRIYYNNRLIGYPLRPLDCLAKLGVLQSLLVIGSYIRARLRPVAEAEDLAQWMTNRFGRRLYQMFFQAYTEKVWGMPAQQISSDWAAQRVKSLSVAEVLKNALGLAGGRHRSLIGQFEYPRLGVGMMWRRMADFIGDGGGRIAFQHQVGQIHHQDGQVMAVTAHTPQGRREYRASHFVSSMPLRELILSLEPAAPAAVRRAAKALRYRNMITVMLIVNEPDIFPDNWIYIQSPHVQVGRIQNYKNWSPDMVPDAAKTSLGLEYYCWEDGDSWHMPQEELIALGQQECAELELINPDQVVAGTVARVPKAYPVYDRGYAQRVGTIREYLSSLPNLQVIGRNGMHRYNNMDHSMMTGLLAARNICGEDHNLWQVNVGEDYLETADK